MNRTIAWKRGAFAVAATTFALSSIAACGDDKPSTGATTSAAGGNAGDLPQGGDPYEIDPADFTADITNPYWPMKVGTRWTYQEFEADGTVLDIEVVITDQTKTLANGVTARVVRDTVYEDGEIVEDTLDWYAQDGDGNVWYMGEDTAEFENGVEKCRCGAWEAGVDGALPGILIPADPAVGMQYRQEYYEGEAEDNGEVLSLDQTVESPHGRFEDALLTRDTSALEPEINEYKLYAKGVGLVLAVHVSGGTGREVLIKVDEVPPGTGTGPIGDPNP